MSCYVHHIPGRLRVRLPDAKGNAAAAQRLASQVNALAGVTQVEANPVTGSLLIRYDSTVTDAAVCLAILKVRPSSGHGHPPSPRTARLGSKMAEAAVWFVLEKAVERYFPLFLAALF